MASVATARFPKELAGLRRAPLADPSCCTTKVAAGDLFFIGRRLKHTSLASKKLIAAGHRATNAQHMLFEPDLSGGVLPGSSPPVDQSWVPLKLVGLRLQFCFPDPTSKPFDNGQWLVFGVTLALSTCWKQLAFPIEIDLGRWQVGHFDPTNSNSPGDLAVSRGTFALLH